ncbi:uncharacterized protein N7529_004786 [Penicillium soppii]|uniref:uncharacterized protein n=1 Tax=Penicillium soppii TaxID=69789 RepID=UPI002549283B|nr:uncharacterized protein N7529_004786 [Penicillium soppii]KAJ5872433.1 hypothetical protein N7529_004786 [Penicillium soppii]
MRLSLALSFLPLALSVAALKVTEPVEGAEVDVSKSFTVKWTSVNTDETTVNIVLVNNNVYPPVEEKIASDIDTSKGSYTASGLKDVTDGHGFQVNLLSTSEHNTGILAQSQQFNVTESSKSSTTSTATGSTTSTGTATGTSTGTSTGTATGLTTSASTTGTASGTASASATPSTGAAMSLIAQPIAIAGMMAGALAFNLTTRCGEFGLRIEYL